MSVLSGLIALQRIQNISQPGEEFNLTNKLKQNKNVCQYLRSLWTDDITQSLLHNLETAVTAALVYTICTMPRQ